MKRKNIKCFNIISARDKIWDEKLKPSEAIKKLTELNKVHDSRSRKFSIKYTSEKKRVNLSSDMIRRLYLDHFSIKLFQTCNSSVLKYSICFLFLTTTRRVHGIQHHSTGNIFIIYVLLSTCILSTEILVIS